MRTVPANLLIVLAGWAICGCAPSQQEVFRRERESLYAAERRIAVTPEMKAYVMQRYARDVAAELPTPVSRVQPPVAILASHNDVDGKTHVWAVGQMEVQNVYGAIRREQYSMFWSWPSRGENHRGLLIGAGPPTFDAEFSSRLARIAFQ